MKEAHFIWNEEWAFTVDFTPPIKCRSNSCTDVATGLSYTIQTTIMYFAHFHKIISSKLYYLVSLPIIHVLQMILGVHWLKHGPPCQGSLLLQSLFHSVAVIMYFCWPTQKLASPCFPGQKANKSFPLAFGLLQKIGSMANKRLTHFAQ